MKTTKSLSRKMKTTVTGLTLITITALFFASCKKDESLKPAASLQTATVNDRLIDLGSHGMVFAQIKIDHISVGLAMPDYSVTVNSNGEASYEGRRNVYVLRSLEFKVSASALLEINRLCIRANLSPIKDKGERDAIANFPHVITTYTPSNSKLSLIFTDYYTGSPANVVIFRAGVEKALNTEQFTKHFIGFPDTGNGQ